MSNPALKHLLEMKSTNEKEQLRLSLEKGKLEGKEEQLISRGDSHSPVNNQVLRDIKMKQEEVETSLAALRGEHDKLRAAVEATELAAAAKPAVEDILSSLSATVAQAMQFNSQPAQNTASPTCVLNTSKEKWDKILTKAPPHPTTASVIIYLLKMTEDLKKKSVKSHRQVNTDEEMVGFMLHGV